MAIDVALTDDSVAALDPAFNDVGAMRSLLSEASHAGHDHPSLAALEDKGEHDKVPWSFYSQTAQQR